MKRLEQNKMTICHSKIESFKEIYAKNRNSEKLKREIKLKFKRKIDKK